MRGEGGQGGFNLVFCFLLVIMQMIARFLFPSGPSWESPPKPRRIGAQNSLAVRSDIVWVNATR